MENPTSQFGYPTPSASEHSASLSHESKRRRIQDSSQSGSELGVSTDGPYVAERFRVGVPGLHLLPLWGSEPLSLPSTVNRINEIRPEILRILQDRGVDFEEDDVNLVHRTIPGDRESEDDLTLLVVANWSDDGNSQSWLDAATDLRSLLVRTSALTRNINVELIHRQLTVTKNMDVVEASHPLVAAWPTIKLEVHAIIESHPKLNGGWCSVDVIRLGYEVEDAMDPVYPVTVSITVDWALNRVDWYEAETEIKTILDNHGFSEVQVEIERGQVEPLARFPLNTPNPPANQAYEWIEGDYPERVSLGDDFGPERYFRMGPGDSGRTLNGGSATIGGYLEVRRNNGPWRKYAVTNYHCIRQMLDGYSIIPGPSGDPMEAPVVAKSELDVIDRKGVGPNRTGLENVTFESPSRRKHNHSLAYHDREIQRLENVIAQNPNASASDLRDLEQAKVDHRASKQRKIDYFDQGKHRLGRLYICSGFGVRRPNNHRIDTALLEVVPSKVGDNTIPDKSRWGPIFSPPIVVGRILDDMTSCKSADPLGDIFKVGARTGATTGKYSHIKSDVKWRHDDRIGKGPTEEYCYVSTQAPPANPFTDSGDSGSFAFTDIAKWLGQVWGGTTKQGALKRLSYITDAEDIIGWINGLTNKDRTVVYEARLAES